jgi:hypothetical protein
MSMVQVIVIVTTKLNNFFVVQNLHELLSVNKNWESATVQIKT